MTSCIKRGMGLFKLGVNMPPKVSFHRGELAGRTEVVNIIERMSAGRIALILKTTPFYPLDRGWPVQPADRGVIEYCGHSFSVEECDIYAVNKKTGKVCERFTIPEKERDGWDSMVAHIIRPNEGMRSGDFFGEEVTCRVDAQNRKYLSLQHSASYLSSFALNKVLSSYWKKEEKTDSLGSRNFQKYLNSSFIYTSCSKNTYSIGGSDKKFDSEVLIQEIKEINREINRILDFWLDSESTVKTLGSGSLLDDKRVWKCVLPEGEAISACTGTHISTLSVFKEIQCQFFLDPDSTCHKSIFEAITVAVPKK